MGRFLLDTTVLIDLSKGVPRLRARLDALVADRHDLGVCAVNLAEFFAGLPVGERGRWLRMLDEFEYWDISAEAAVQAGAFRYASARRGRTIHTPDALVAGLATVLGATILTDNAKHFPTPDVRVESTRDWTSRPPQA